MSTDGPSPPMPNVRPLNIRSGNYLRSTRNWTICSVPNFIILTSSLVVVIPTLVNRTNNEKVLRCIYIRKTTTCTECEAMEHFCFMNTCTCFCWLEPSLVVALQMALPLSYMYGDEASNESKFVRPFRLWFAERVHVKKV